VSNIKSRRRKSLLDMKILEERLERYLLLTKDAIDKVKISKEKQINWKESAEDFLDMAKRYLSDAVYFKKKGDFVRAFACVNYAHGWLDAGARLGLFDVGKDNRLFSVD